MHQYLTWIYIYITKKCIDKIIRDLLSRKVTMTSVLRPEYIRYNKQKHEGLFVVNELDFWCIYEVYP